jgi:hypothetical protein
VNPRAPWRTVANASCAARAGFLRNLRADSSHAPFVGRAVAWTRFGRGENEGRVTRRGFVARLSQWDCEKGRKHVSPLFLDRIKRRWNVNLFGEIVSIATFQARPLGVEPGGRFRGVLARVAGSVGRNRAPSRLVLPDVRVNSVIRQRPFRLGRRQISHLHERTNPARVEPFKHGVSACFAGMIQHVHCWCEQK